MSYELELQKNNPMLFDSLNGSSPPLVAGSGSSSLLTSGLDHTTDIFSQGYESVPFSLELWYLPVEIAGEVVVMGHSDEGVLFDGQTFTLRVKFDDTTQIEASWTPDQIESYYLVLEYDGLSFSLYVNNDLELSLDMPPGQVFAYTGSSLSLNTVVSGTASGVYDSLAVYPRTLSEQIRADHFRMAKDLLSSVQVASSHGGWTYELSYDSIDTLQRIVYDASNWNAGLLDGVTATSTSLTSDSGGEWTVSIPIDAIYESNVAGINITGVGTGFTIDYSTDQTTWQPIEGTILQDATPAGLDLWIRLTLSALAEVKTLSVDLLSTRSMLPFAGNRELLFYNATFDRTPGHQLDYQEDQGATLSQGYVEIQPDPDNLTSVGTVEAWLKFTSDTGWVLGNTGTNYVNLSGGNISATGATIYINGQAVANGSPVPMNQWVHCVLVLTSVNNSPIRLGAKLAGTDFLDMSVGHVAVYPQIMSSQEAEAVYEANVGAPSLTIVDSGLLSVTEDPVAADIFAYTWTKAA
jgi:hypothetical protein